MSDEIDAGTLCRFLAEGAVDLVDIRDEQSWRDRRIAGSRLVDQAIDEKKLRSATGLTVVYCQQGVRSLRLVRELGNESLRSLRGGFSFWQSEGFACEGEGKLSELERQRFSRQIMLPGVGESGQERLKRSRVLIVGAGGLGTPAALYLARAGVGTIGMADGDDIESSNLPRQVFYDQSDVGQSKADVSKRRVEQHGCPNVVSIAESLGEDNIDRWLDLDWQLVIDAADSPELSYLLADACRGRHLPVLHASAIAMVGTLMFGVPGSCFRCLYPNPAPPGLFQNCDAAGVLAPIPGVVGTLLASEALKYILGLGDMMRGELMQFDFMSMDVQRTRFRSRCAPCDEQVFSSMDGELECGFLLS